MLQLEPCIISSPEAEIIKIEKPIQISYGEKIAIIGESGSKKTTSLEALADLNINTRKHLFIGNKSVNDISDEQQLHLIRYCPQQAQFLEGEINHSVFLTLMEIISNKLFIRCLYLVFY